MLSFSTSGSGNLDEPLTITCNVSIADGLVGLMNNLTIEKK